MLATAYFKPRAMPKRKCNLGDVGDQFPDHVPVALGDQEKRLLVPKKMTLEELRTWLGIDDDLRLADSSATLPNESMKTLQEPK